MTAEDVAAPLVKLLVFAAVTLLLTALLAQTLGASRPAASPTAPGSPTSPACCPATTCAIAGVRVGQVSDIAVVDDTVAEVAFTVDRRRAGWPPASAPRSATATWSASGTSR